jgi:glucosylceramidase
MKAKGINIWAITPQNEPENPNNEPSMSMNVTEQKNFINNNLGPALASAGYLGVKIIAFDHNCDNTAYPIDVCNNSTYVDGAAFHLYAGNISAMTTVKNATNKNVYFTEQYTASNGSFSGDLGWHLQNVVIGSSNNWSKAVIEWNLANNSSFGPHTPSGCTTCQGAITINSTSSYTRNVSYYIIGQISKFVKPGAQRIKSLVSGSNFTATTFKNTDGTISVVTYNASSSSQTLKLVWNSKSVQFTIPASSTATYTWDANTNSISKTFSDSVILTPNPGKSIVKVRNVDNNMPYKSISFMSVDGKIALFHKIKLPETTIDISGLANGVYMTKMYGNSNSICGKFIKQ